MAEKIILKTGRVSSRSLNATKNDLQRAVKELNAINSYGAMANARYTCNGVTQNIFSSDMIQEAGALLARVDQLLSKTESYAKLLSAGPEALQAIDASYKGKYTNAWQRTWNNIFGGVSSVIGMVTSYWTSIFHKGGNKTGGQTVISGESEGESNTEPNKEPQNSSDSEKENARRVAVDRANEKVSVGEPQNSDSWMCTWASTATMLRRQQAIDGVEPSFTRDSVYSSNQRMVFATNYTDSAGHTYSTATEDSSEMASNMANRQIKSKKEYLKTMLDEHPAGIVIYSNYQYTDKQGNPQTGQHAIVLTDYKIRDDGSIQFYADDSVNDREDNLGWTEIENTWMYSVNSNVLDECFRIWYVT